MAFFYFTLRRDYIKSVIHLTFLFLLLFVWSGSSYAGKARVINDKKLRLSQKLFNEIEELSTILLEKCPPPKCKLIGIGRSVTPFYEYLKLVSPEAMLQVPLSRFTHTPYEELANRSVYPLTEGQERSFKIHMDSFVKEQLSSDVERVLVFDFTATGETIYSFQEYFDRYIHAEKLIWDQDYLALVHHLGRFKRLASHQFFRNRGPMIHLSLTLFRELNSALNTQDFDLVSEYKMYILYDEYEPPQKLNFKRDDREIFQDWLRRGISGEELEHPSCFSKLVSAIFPRG